MLAQFDQIATKFGLRYDHVDTASNAIVNKTKITKCTRQQTKQTEKYPWKVKGSDQIPLLSNVDKQI